MDRITSLSTGSKIVLGCGVSLFFSLFVTWQNLQVDFGQAGIATLTLDGWDFWGLLIGLLAVGIVALVVVVHATEVEVSEDIPWEGVMLGLGGSSFGLTLLRTSPTPTRLDELPRPCSRGGRRRGRILRLVDGARVGASVQPLEQEHSIFAGPVVVLHHAIDLKAECLVEGHRLLVRR